MAFLGKVKKVRIVRNNNSETYRTIVVVGDDNENEVVNVAVTLEGTPNPAENPAKCSYKNDQEDGDRRFVNDTQTFEKDAIGVTYTAKTQMLNADGKQLGDGQSFEVTVEAPKIKVKKVRIVRNNNSETYRTIAVVGGDTDSIVDTVRVEFDGEPNPQPNLSQISCPYKNDQEDGDRRFVNNNDLSFRENAVGVTYNVKTIMFDADKNVVGDEGTKEVTVEGNADA